MKAVLIAGGNMEAAERLKKLAAECDAVICADHGYDYAKKLGVSPDVIMGDMDSLKSSYSNITEYVYPTRKDYTDSELITEYAVQNGYTQLYMFAFTGTRMDHTLVNLSFLCRYKDFDAVIINDNNEIRAVKKENIICGEKGDILSLIPMGSDLVGITTENLEYPLTDETLVFGTGRGVSNVMTADICRISVKSGNGLIIKSTD